MKHTVALFIVIILLCSCGEARTEVSKSLKNIPQATRFLMSTELDEGQARAVQAIAIAVNPAIDWIDTDWLGRDIGTKHTVGLEDWKANTETAKQGVVAQAARAQSAVDGEQSMIAGWNGVFWAGVATIFGGTLAQMARSIVTRGQALAASIEFGMDALNADTPAAKLAVKTRAVNRKKGTGFGKVLDKALMKVRDDRLDATPEPVLSDDTPAT